MSMPLDYSAVAVGSAYTNSSEGQLKCLLPAQLPSSSFANNRKELVLRPSQEAAISDTKIIKHVCDFWYGEKQQKVCRTDLAVGVAGHGCSYGKLKYCF